MTDTRWSPQGVVAMDAAVERLVRELPEINQREIGLVVLQAAEEMKLPLRPDALAAAVLRRYASVGRRSGN